jgi:hypothetical protein
MEHSLDTRRLEESCWVLGRLEEAAVSLDHAQWSMMHSHIRMTTTN